MSQSAISRAKVDRPTPTPASAPGPGAAAAQAPAQPVAPQEAAPPEAAGLPFSEQVLEWIRSEGAWWASSFVFHMLLMCVLMLVSTRAGSEYQGEPPSFEEAEQEPLVPEQKLDRFEVGETPLEPTELTTDTLTLMNFAPGGGPAQEEIYYDDNPVFIEAGGGMAAPGAASGPSLGGLGGFTVVGTGPGIAVRGGGGVGVGIGTGTNPGVGGGGSGFGGRGQGHRKAMVGGFGGTRQSERAVAAALNWLARHQSPNGSWSLKDYNRQCTDPTCTGPGTAKADAGATALGLLPFLAAGQTHRTKGPYQQTIYRGLYWLMQNQKADGNLAAGAGSPMYSHGLATITLCEAYGLSKDDVIRRAATAAIRFIENAQHPRTGGWRYNPGEEGDTSVVGWQVMALKSAQMAGLSVSPRAFEGAKTWLKSCSKGNYGGNFCYQPESPATPTMTSVGLLCWQYMGAKPDEPMMQEGLATLLRHMPDNKARDMYYWYYATQVLHNVPGPDWDKWNRQMRRVLIETQCKDGCAAGSWDPDKPTRDRWGDAGGRLYVTSLAALTLEVYYRYLPLYKLGGNPAQVGGLLVGSKEPAKEPAKAPTKEKDKESSKAAPPAKKK